MTAAAQSAHAEGAPMEDAPSPPASSSRARGLAALALLLVFLAGAGTGWGVGARVGFGHGGGRRGARNGMLLDGGPMERYGLSAAQRTRIDSVLEARRGQIDAFWRGPGLTLRAILDSTRADVRAVLTPEQRARFDSARAEHDRRMRGRYGPGGRPGPGGGPMGPPGPRLP